MIKVGQIYKEKELPNWRKYEKSIYVVTCIDFNQVNLISPDGKVDIVSYDWLKEDCELIAEYPTWQEAVNSKEFKGE